MKTWVDHAEARVWRVVSLVCLAGAAFFFVCSAYAQSCEAWTVNDGAGFSTALGPGEGCAVFEAWFEAFGGGREVVSCTGASGTYSAATNGPSGSVTWTLTGGTCAGGGTTPTPTQTVTLVLPAAFSLSAEDGAFLGVAIISVWLAAFAWRAAMRALDVADGSYEDE